jgi:hypothetical protein
MSSGEIVHLSFPFINVYVPALTPLNCSETALQFAENTELKLKSNDRPILSPESMLHKDYNRKCSVEKKNTGHGSQGFGAKMN